MSFEALRREPYLSLATFRKDGREVATPVWFAHDDDGSLVVVTGGDSGKVKRLRNFSRSRIAVCDMRGGVAEGAVWGDTETTFIDGAEDVRRAHRALRKKYGWQLVLLDVAAWFGRRLDKRAYLRIRPAADANDQHT